MGQEAMYHYKECGLPNVWLQNGYKTRQTPYGEAVGVEDADGLLKALALDVAQKKGRMTGKELRFLRGVLCLSQASLANLLGGKEQSLSLWERTGRVPKSADTLMRVLVLQHFGGNTKISELVARMNDVERMVNQRTVARAKDHAWTAKTRAAPVGAPAGVSTAG